MPFLLLFEDIVGEHTPEFMDRSRVLRLGTVGARSASMDSSHDAVLEGVSDVG